MLEVFILGGDLGMQSMLCQMVPMRDDVRLATDVWLPDGSGPWPVVLMRTPYHRTSRDGLAGYYTDREYVLIVQDTRGKYDSEGQFRALEHEADDGRDTLDWIAEQRWCNGRIGMVGRSYLGIVQIPAAAGGHEALQCIIPAVAPQSYFTDWVRYGGCFALANLVRWPLTHTVCRTKPYSEHFTWKELWEIGAAGSLADVEKRAGCVSQQLREWVERDSEDDYWKSLDQTRMYSDVACAGMHHAGYFDHISRGQYLGFSEIGKNGASQFARENQYLLVGPWGHGGYDQTSYGEWDFGSDAAIDTHNYWLRFLNLWLKDIDDGVSEEPRARYFQMGENRWKLADSWPPASVKYHDWYLDSGGGARGLGGSGRLTRATPDAQVSDEYTYDPANPVPTHGGQVYWGLSDFYEVGPVDQHSILRRDDVLFYRSERLDQLLEITGDVNLDLWIASSAPDTDFIAKLCVVEPMGPITVLTVGSLRCRYRESWENPTPLEPNTATRITIYLGQIGYTFPCGSRIGLIVTSSSFPRILPHRNTMKPTWQEQNPQTATQHVLHGKETLSRLTLPVIEP